MTYSASTLWSRTPRFVRNALISLPTFLLDLVLLIVLVQYLHWSYLAATIIAFLMVNLVSYLLARRLVFAETRRGMKTGLAYYILIAALSGAMLTALMWVLVSVLHVDYVVSRVVAAGAAGLGGYLLNLVFNFRLARPNLRKPE